MKKRRFLLIPLLLGLLLTGCFGGDDSEDIDGGDESSQKTTNDVAEEDILENMDYEKREGWPTQQLASFLSSERVNETVPALTNIENTYYHENNDANNKYFSIVIPGSDREADYKAILEGAGYTYNKVGWTHIAVNSEETINIAFQYMQDHPVLDYAMLIVVTALKANSFRFDKLENDIGWPDDQLETFLSKYGITETVPSLTGGTFFAELTERNEFIVCAPGVDFADNYLGSLENEGYTVTDSNAISASGKVRINVTANDYPFFFFDATKIVIKPVV
ncbi:MAG: hypothetical protein BWX74_00338 [Tenericutes bacterium ADurb.Bin087]|nr:MAG: hypothetical protein BWX74_00338 [Tenericutes bacterium ADurb.Bin087]